MKNPETVPAETLTRLAEEILTALEVPLAKARLVAESLVAANLRGVDSHGVNLLPAYAEQLAAGNIDAAADGRVVSESQSCLLYDGQQGIGQYVADVCCHHAVRLASKQGLGMVVARRSNHFGAAAFWGQRISAAGMIGVVMTNSSPSVPPWQGKEGRLGSNPICVSIPSRGSGAWLLDMATSTVAMNKILRAAASGEETIPAGWALDSQGVPTTNAREALKGLLSPLGGYKGSGLAMLVEIFCAVLSGGPLGSQVGGLYLRERPMGTSQTYLAVEVSRFLPLEEFQTRMERLVRDVKSSSAAVGFTEVLVAGDPEQRAEEVRSRKGIPLDTQVWERLTELAGRLGVALEW